MAREPFAPATQILAPIPQKFEAVETPKKMEQFCLIFKNAIVVVKRPFNYFERLSAPSFRPGRCLAPSALKPTCNQGLVCEIYQPGLISFSHGQGSLDGITRTRITRQPAGAPRRTLTTGDSYERMSRMCCPNNVQ